MFALVNTFGSSAPHILGSVLSLHRTHEAAQASNLRVQRTIRQGSGAGHYLPTTIVRMKKGRWRKGQHIHKLDTVITL